MALILSAETEDFGGGGGLVIPTRGSLKVWVGGVPRIQLRFPEKKRKILEEYTEALLFIEKTFLIAEIIMVDFEK